MKNLVENLKKQFSNLIPIKVSEDAPVSEKTWSEWANSLRHSVLDMNVNNFLNWPVIKQTMFVDQQEYINVELNNLYERDDWFDKWSEAIRETPIGAPNPYKSYPESSGNTIHTAYHLAQFEDRESKVSDMHLIVEFGGGYGNICRVVHELGFNGMYIIFDLKPLSYLQEFYLKSSGINVYSPGGEMGTVLCISSLDELNGILAGFNLEKSMFIATWSLSESPKELRDSILEAVSGLGTFLIAYQDVFCGEDFNNDYFRNWVGSIKSCTNWKIKHLPGNRYLMGSF